MNFRFTAILFGTVFALGVVLLIFSFVGDDKPPTDVLAEELVAFKPADIDTVEFERESGGKLKLQRVNKDRNLWNIVEPYAAKADPAAISEVVTALLKAKPTAHPELTSSPARHGLQPPGLKVTLRAGERASTINFGDVTMGGSKAVVFVTTSAQPKRPMAVPRSSVEAVFRQQNADGKAADMAKFAGDFRQRSVFATDPRGGADDATAITLTARNKTLALERSGGAWKFTAPAGWGLADSTGDVSAPPGSFTGVSRLLGTITNLQATSVADFVDSPTPQQLTDAGLNEGNPDRIKVELKNRDNETITAFIGKADAAPPAPAAPGMPPAGGKRWVQVVGQTGIIRATAGDLSGLVAVIENPDPLRDRTLLALDASRIDGLDLASGAVKLRKTGVGMGSWKMYGNPGAGDPTAATGVERIVAVLTEKRIIKSFPAPNPANFDGGVKVLVWSEGVEANTDAKADPRAEPKMKGKPVTLTFGKKEGDAVHVRREVEGTPPDYFLLPEKVKLPPAGEQVELLAAVSKSRLDLLDPALKTFATTSANKITVAGTANYELNREDAPEGSAAPPAWKFAKPDDRKGQSADVTVLGDVLSLLATTQSVTRFIDESPDAAKLAEYGLGAVPGRAPMPGDPPAPRLKVTIGLKDPDPTDKERVYEFGKETADPNYVYARQAGRAAVFTLPKFLVEKFTTTDLQDRQLFRFDPAQATSVKFTGWQAVAGFMVELQFDKNKEGVWTVVKSPPGYVVDPAKVNAFLATLSRTRVKEFVKGAPAPGQGVGDPKENFHAFITIANHPGIIVNIWAPTDGGASYFATTSLRPAAEPVIKLDASPFKLYKDSSAAFAK